MSAALEFLLWHAPEGPWCLTAIKPDTSSIATRTFVPGEEADLDAWVARHHGTWNLYFHINPVQGRPRKKASKSGIAEVRWLHVDMDPRVGENLDAERERILAALQAYDPSPSAIIDSGGGYWGLWRLRESLPAENGGEAEQRNAALATALGGDACSDIFRIARLPGTMNIPDARKRKKGRTEALSRLVEHHVDRVYDASEFPAGTSSPPHLGGARDEGGREVADLTSTRISDLVELDEWGVSDHVHVVIEQGCDPDQPDRWPSRSEAVFYVCCELTRRKVPDEVTLGIITDPRWAISAHVLDQPKSEQYARRQISNARERTMLEFQIDDRGKPYPNQHNIRVALNRLGVTLSHDQFADRLNVEGLPGYGPTLQDEAVARLWLEIEGRFGFRPGKDFFWTVIEDIARRNGSHPVRDYLDSLQWDGTPRVDCWLHTYGGAEDTPFVRAVGALFLVAAVRRIREPGCKFDEMLVLESPQGQLKSSALRVLAVREDWFSDDLPLSADAKIIIERLHGCWIVEAADLNGMRKSEVEHLKSFLSRRIDRSRMAYGRITKVVPRQCIFVGTTNSDRYLRDNTGNRRFWPVRVGKFDLNALKFDRDQLWAEAAQREAAGESIRLDPALYVAAGEAQEERRVEDPFVGRLAATLGDLHGKLRSEDAWKIVDVPSGQRTQEHNRRLGDAMRELGWERAKLRFGGQSVRAYARGSDQERMCQIEVYAHGNGVPHAGLAGGEPF